VSNFPISIHIEAFALGDVNEALRKLKAGVIRGSAVLQVT